LIRVVLDGEAFETDRLVGIWRYFFEVLPRLADRVDLTLWLRNDARQAVPQRIPILRDYARTAAAKWDVLARLTRKWSVRYPPAKARSAQILHPTYYQASVIPGPAQVITVYDMISERMFPICGDWALPDIARKRSAIQESALCICISQATADDLLMYYPNLVGRVRVVHLGADHLGDPVGVPPETMRAGRIALFVGHRNWYKNFWLVPEAMQTSDWPPDLVLHVIGPPPDDHELAKLKTYGLKQRVRFLGKLTDTDLRRQYQAAQCIVFPSLMEGFGLPLLEAQVNGCAVICSDIPAFREVAGQAAAFFDPRLAEQLAIAVAGASEPETWRQLVAAGYDNVRRFSWDRAADETLQVYEEVAQFK
jgi:glycosyltransferase involved in cell wall biosynthesis